LKSVAVEINPRQAQVIQNRLDKSPTVLNQKVIVKDQVQINAIKSKVESPFNVEQIKDPDLKKIMEFLSIPTAPNKRSRIAIRCTVPPKR